MLGAILTLLGFELIGELVRSVLHLPIPGPVVGMILLAVVLAVQARKKPPSELREVTPLDKRAEFRLAESDAISERCHRPRGALATALQARPALSARDVPGPWHRLQP